MSLFTSARERRLWLWTLLVVATIYLTLPLAGTLSGFLRERNLLGSLFILGWLLVVVAIAGQSLKRHPGGREIWVLIGVAGVYLVAWSRIESPEERTHLIEYGLVAVLVFEALSERYRQGHRTLTLATFAVLATALLGWIDEGIQATLPNRVYDIRDVGFNALAAFMAIIASLILS